MTVIWVVVGGVILLLTFVSGAIVGWLVGNFLQETREKDVLRELEREKGKNDLLIQELAKKHAPPPPLPPPIDPAPLVRAIGEAITSVYNPPQPAVTVTETVTPIPSITPSTPSSTLAFFPDVEMDEWLRSQEGFPTHGGWINPDTNGQTPPIDGQSPVHRVVDGKVKRLDGQPLFRAGEGQTSLPTGEFDG